MALSNSSVATNANQGTQVTGGQRPAANGKAKKTNGNEQLVTQGNEILASMTTEQRNELSAKSGTLVFQHLLGLASKKSSRRVNKDQSQDCSTPVGVRLKTEIDIADVPVIDITKNKDTGIDPETDITYREVKAGETFDLSYYEFMYLILRNDYAGFCSNGQDDRGVYFSVKVPAFFSGSAKLPTPTINFKTGSVKAGMVDIDEKVNNTWEIKPEWKEKFGALLQKSTPKRSSGSKDNVPAPQVIAVALQQILKINK
jgi:hypothetical protein